MSEPLRIVVHPMHGVGLIEALAVHPELSVTAPEHGQGVLEELASGTRALITYHWDERYASGGLRWVQALSAGVEQFPQRLLKAKGIALTSARGAHSPAVAEHAIALMMAVLRQIGPAVRSEARREWEPTPAYEVGGRTLGVLGLGSIGQTIATKALALGMTVIGTKRDPSSFRHTEIEVYPPQGTLEVCRRADILIVSLPADPSTDSLVGAEELAALGSGWLVNVGRGGVVDEVALVEALTEGELRGAGLDVTTTEPLPGDSPLWDLPHVIVTPHMGWSSDRLAGRLADLIVANARALREGEAWVNRIV